LQKHVLTQKRRPQSLDESLHLMQEQEGLSLAMHFEEDFEEVIDWYEPVGTSPAFSLLFPLTSAAQS